MMMVAVGGVSQLSVRPAPGGRRVERRKASVSLTNASQSSQDDYHGSTQHLGRNLPVREWGCGQGGAIVKHTLFLNINGVPDRGVCEVFAHPSVFTHVFCLCEG